MASYPNVNAAIRYAREVVQGKIVVNQLVKAACQRHFDDLERAKLRTSDFPYVFGKDLAERNCEFIQLLPHAKGKWAAKKELIVLQPWQLFIQCMIYGWVHRKAKTRRFRTAYIAVPRKNGKSVIAAGNGLFLFAADREYGSEVYCGATNEKQALEVFRPAKAMAKKTPDLLAHFGIEVNAKSLFIGNDESRFEPVIGDPADGASPHCFIIDEYHEHRTSAMLDTAQTGMMAREQPLTLIITTAGFNVDGACYQFELDIRDLLEGKRQDDQTFGIVYGLDKDDDWTDPALLPKANPNFGVSINAQTMLQDHKQAVQLAHKANAFKTKHFNVWVAAANAFFNMQHWNQAKDITLDVSEFCYDDGWFCLDLASKIDIAAFIRVFIRHIDGVIHYYIFPRFYIPYDTAHDTEHPSYDLYQEWIKHGELEVTGDAEIDFNAIQADVEHFSDGHQVREIPHDQWNALQMAKNLYELGHNPVAVPQTAAHFSPAMKELEAALAAGRVHHDGNRVLTWMIGNVTSHEDWKGNHFPRKETKNSTRKIDGAVATIMGVGRAMHDEGEYSPYDDPNYDASEANLDD